MAKILIVDDDPGVRDFVSLLLRRSGHDVLAASTGQQALEMTTSSLPDLIVSDIRMSEMD